MKRDLRREMKCEMKRGPKRSVGIAFIGSLGLQCTSPIISLPFLRGTPHGSSNQRQVGTGQWKHRRYRLCDSQVPGFGGRPRHCQRSYPRRPLKRLVTKLKDETGGTLLGFAGDLSQAAVATELSQQHPGVEILVNNLGIFEPKPFEDIPDEDWVRFFEANVLSGVRLARLYLPAMRKADWGRIIFISSDERSPNPAGDDPLRHDQNSANRRRARSGRVLGRYWDYRKLGSARTDPLSRRGGTL